MRSGKLKCVESTGATCRLILENNCNKTEPTADMYIRDRHCSFEILSGSKMIKEQTKAIRARVNPEGLMGSACRVHKPTKGKGSFARKPKHGGSHD